MCIASVSQMADIHSVSVFLLPVSHCCIPHGSTVTDCCVSPSTDIVNLKPVQNTVNCSIVPGNQRDNTYNDYPCSRSEGISQSGVSFNVQHPVPSNTTRLLQAPLVRETLATVQSNE